VAEMLIVLASPLKQTAASRDFAAKWWRSSRMAVGRPLLRMETVGADNRLAISLAHSREPEEHE